jgi:hypothetical protein
MAKKPMSACSPVTASTDLPAVSNTASSSSTPRRGREAARQCRPTRPSPRRRLAPSGAARISDCLVLMLRAARPVGLKARTMSAE